MTGDLDPSTQSVPDQNEAERERAEIAAVAMKCGALGLSSVGMTFMALIAGLLLTGQAIMSGSELVAVFALLAVVVVVFYAMLFNRPFRVRARKGDDSIDIEVRKQ